MRRTDLHEDPAKALGKLIGTARGAGESAQTRPTGQLHLGDGDAVWDRPDGTQGSVKQLPSAIDVEKLLQEGLSTETRRTTVSTSQPSVTDGFPEGAWWTQTTSASDNTVAGVWRLTDGEWAQQEATGDLTAFPYADIGLLNVAVLSAQIITSGYFRTAATGKRIEIDSLGVRAYNDSGDNTVNINGFDNLLTGGIRTAASGRRTEMLNVIWGSLWSGIRMYPEETARPVEIKTAPFKWKDYPAGSLYLTSAADAVSRGELVVANDRFNLNFEDQATGVQTRYIEVIRGGSTRLASGDGTNGSSRSALFLDVDRFSLILNQGTYIQSIKSGATSIYGDTGVSLIVPGGPRVNLDATTFDVGSPRFTHGSNPVATYRTATSGTLDDLRTPDRYKVQHNSTPSGSWGNCDVLVVGNGVVEQRFTTDAQGDWREWRRRSTSATAWGAWTLLRGGPTTNRTSFVDWNFNDGQTARINYDLGGTPAGMSWDSGSRQLVVSQAGTYEVSFMATADIAGPNGWHARMQVGGTNVAAPQRYGRGTNNHTVTRPIAAGGTVSIEIANFSGGALRIQKNADLTRLDVTHVGP